MTESKTIEQIAREDDYKLDFPEPEFDPFEAPECCQ